MDRQQNMDKPAIEYHLRAHHQSFVGMIFTLSEADFLFALPGKWTAGQQLEHIYRSIAPVKLAFTLPKFLLRLFFGKANRPPKDYNSLVNKYHQKLAAGGKAPSIYLPKTVAFSQKEHLKSKLFRNVNSLCKQLDIYEESELDLYLLPHPLLGKLTLREMLYFTIYHVEHHHKATLRHLERKYSTSCK